MFLIHHHIIPKNAVGRQRLEQSWVFEISILALDLLLRTWLIKMPEVSLPFLLQSHQLAQAIRNNPSEPVSVNLKGNCIFIPLHSCDSSADSYRSSTGRPWSGGIAPIRQYDTYTDKYCSLSSTMQHDG
jgi:hypothetical protein